MDKRMRSKTDIIRRQKIIIRTSIFMHHAEMEALKQDILSQLFSEGAAIVGPQVAEVITIDADEVMTETAEKD